MLAPGGTIEGTILILLAREAIGLALAAEEQGARLFRKASKRTSRCPVRHVDKDGKEQLREAFMDGTPGPIMLGCHYCLRAA